jgi:thiopeptide-type bacteriocin biosynthesis protein
MTVAAQARFTSEDWLYYRFYPGAYERLDDVLRACVAPAVELARALGTVDHWFFIRYLDGRGPHVRLRFAASPHQLAVLEDELEQRFIAALDDLDSGASAGPFVGFDQSIYEPETAKYGGDAGLELSYPLFESSSELALAAVLAGWSADRFSLGLLLMREAVARVVAEADRAHFLRAYKQHWCAQGVAASGPLVQRVERTAAARGAAVRQRAAVLAAEPPTRRPVGRYLRELTATFACPERAAASADDEDLLFNYIHLMNNRLGIRPWEEAVLAQVLLLGDLELTPSTEESLR